MEREQGSNAEQVEIFGGMYDGAMGIVLGRQEKDGKVLTQVQLPDGTILTLASEIPAEDETPREMGS